MRGVDAWFADRAEAARPTLDEEPERLLELGYARAAVTAAITLLEVQLRGRMDLTTQPTRPMSTGQLAGLASSTGVISREDLNQIPTWLRIRNAAVHTTKPIPMREARTVIRGVRELIQRLARP